MVEPSDKIPCKYCKEEIRLSAKQCPHCGTISPNLQIKSIFGIIFLVLAVFFVYANFILG